MDSHRRNHPKYIPDNFTSLDQVTSALWESGLESSNLILGIDFTKSNEWTGKYSFQRRSLHAVGNIPNPYEQAISIIGRTLSPFDDDNMIPCFGFGDASTHDDHVFSFFADQRSCRGFEEVLSRYREIVPYLKLSGPTSFGPIIDAAIVIVAASNGQYHVLVIIADGQVARSPDLPPGRLSPQEQATINSIVCPICLTNPRDMAFGCGHMTCKECGPTLSICPLCRRSITTRIRLLRQLSQPASGS